MADPNSSYNQFNQPYQPYQHQPPQQFQQQPPPQQYQQYQQQPPQQYQQPPPLQPYQQQQQQSQQYHSESGLAQQDPNAHYQTPPGYVLVPISQVGHPQPQQHLTPQPSYQGPGDTVPSPQLPPRPSSSQTQNAPQPTPAAPTSAGNQNGPSGTGAAASNSAKPEFPTRKPMVFEVHYIDDTKDLFLPKGASPSAAGYEAKYRKMDRTDRENPHTVIYHRDSQGKLREAGTSIYHHYWTNKLTMNLPFLSAPWEFLEAWVSDVGTCEGRKLEFAVGKKEGMQFVLELLETNKKVVAVADMKTLRTGTITMWVPFENQKQMDEMFVVFISFWQRYRIKLVKDSKSLLKDEDWETLRKFTKVANAGVHVGGGGA